MQTFFLEKDYLENLHSIRNPKEKPTVKKLFEVSQRLFREQSEISGVSQISWETFQWERLSLVNDDEIINLSKAKT